MSAYCGEDNETLPRDYALKAATFRIKAKKARFECLAARRQRLNFGRIEYSRRLLTPPTKLKARVKPLDLAQLSDIVSFHNNIHKKL